MDEVENKNHLLGGISSNVNEMQFRKLLRGTFFSQPGSLSSPPLTVWSGDAALAALSGPRGGGARLGAAR